MIAKLAYPVAMLGAVALAIVRVDAAILVATGAVGLGLRFVSARGWRTNDGHLAFANLLTLLRLAIVISLPAWVGAVPRIGFAIGTIVLLVLDGLDGRIARTRGESSAFGAVFDMETDALTVMTLALVLYLGGELGAWVLVAGLWRYAFATAVALWPSLGDCPPSPIYRWIFCALMIGLAGAFLPWPSIARLSAALGTALVSFSFIHSIVRSRAVSLARTA